MEFEQLLQLVESNAKSIEALSNEAANARQELKETRAIADSNAEAILGLAEQSLSDRQLTENLRSSMVDLKGGNIAKLLGGVISEILQLLVIDAAARMEC
jgi:hypothetical protein